MRIRFDHKSLTKGAQRFRFYIDNAVQYIIPNVFYRARLKGMMRHASVEERNAAMQRAAYYVKLPVGSSVGSNGTSVGDFRFPFHQKHKFTTYFFDLYDVLRYFHTALRFNYVFGDIERPIIEPSFVKARSITDEPSNGAIMKLNQVRHFRFISHDKPFSVKKNMVVFRNVVNRQPQRYLLLEKFHDHPLCDVGQVNANPEHPEYVKPFMPIDEQLEYKFICCIEGHDVATNLKWVMSSNSLAVMPEPTMESWFMEGKLIADYHYVKVKPDYSDMIAKVEYYATHREEAEQIIHHAHEWVKMFQDQRQERLTELLTAEQYFKQTEQL